VRIRSRTRPALAVIAALAAGCSSGTDPSSPDRSPAGGGTIDPAASTFVLPLETASGSDRPVRAELIGTNLVVDEAAATISVDVSVANRGAGPLAAPLRVWIGEFRPATVSVLNPDLEVASPTFPHGFDYSERLGDDQVLDPDEVSGPKTWTFHVPDLGSFAFAARLESGTDPAPRPHVGGFVWNDANRNGIRDRDEGPGIGGVQVLGPNGSGGTAFVHPSGRWSVPVSSAGLHRVTYFDPTDGPLGWLATTPNPLEVVLPPDPSGAPQSFDHADFGVVLGRNADPPVPVSMTDRLPDQIPQDRYGLRSASLHGDLFVLDAQYGGGCRPEHPLMLYASPDFGDADRARTWMLLAHDDLADPCDTLIGRTVAFDLGPIRRAYVATYGQPGVVVLDFLDFAGNRHTFEFGP